MRGDIRRYTLLAGSSRLVETTATFPQRLRDQLLLMLERSAWNKVMNIDRFDLATS